MPFLNRTPLTIYARVPAQGDREARYFKCDKISWRTISRFNNGVLISCGWTIGEKYSPRLATIEEWVKAGKAREVTFEEWNHSGCQSSCELRGDQKCSW